jgi:hypothetical protein
MKKLYFLSLTAMIFFQSHIICAQQETAPTPPVNAIGGGFTEKLSSFDSVNSIAGNATVMNIQGRAYFGMRLQPEINIKKIGIGLDIPFLFDLENGKFRNEEYTQGVGVLRFLRYVRYGVKKRDPVYIRVGDISGTSLGYGMLINNYTNAISFERRKVGVTFDVLVKKRVGLEGMYSDFEMTSLNLLGLRPYYRPLGHTELPILKTLEIGATYVTDYDKTGRRLKPDSVVYFQFPRDGVQAFGFDMGFHLVNSSILQISPYIQYSSLVKIQSDSLKSYFENNQLSYSAGHGFSVGANARIRISEDIFYLDTRLERLSYTNNYLPQFFDFSYEVNKDAKILALGTATARSGVFGMISGTLFNTVRVGGNLMLPDNVSINTPATVQVNADLLNFLDRITVRGIYYKSGLTDLRDAFLIDERSLVTARFAYKIATYFQAGVDYRWTFAKVGDGSFKATNTTHIYFGLNYPLGMNRAKNNSL